eukprot:31154-Pelagococcus_subviridis.AAC.7
MTLKIQHARGLSPLQSRVERSKRVELFQRRRVVVAALALAPTATSPRDPRLRLLIPLPTPDRPRDRLHAVLRERLRGDVPQVLGRVLGLVDGPLVFELVQLRLGEAALAVRAASRDSEHEPRPDPARLRVVLVRGRAEDAVQDGHERVLADDEAGKFRARRAAPLLAFFEHERLHELPPRAIVRVEDVEPLAVLPGKHPRRELFPPRLQALAVLLELPSKRDEVVVAAKRRQTHLKQHDAGAVRVEPVRDVQLPQRRGQRERYRRRGRLGRLRGHDVLLRPGEARV